MIDFLAVGHVSQDLTPSGLVAGGTVTYSSRAAHALGCRTAVLTSAAVSFDLSMVLPGIELIKLHTSKTTVFENVYSVEGRKQKVHAVAASIDPDSLPESWRRAKIVHLGPIINEIEPEMIEVFSNSLVGLTPQGWYRSREDDGLVKIQDWPKAKDVLKLAAAVIVSPEDIPDLDLIERFRRWCPLVIMTQGSKGCVVHFRGDSRNVAAPPVEEINPTGAGDIFAASFMIRLHQTRGNPWDAAAFANQVAAASVTKDSLDDKIEIVSKFREGI